MRCRPLCCLVVTLAAACDGGGTGGTTGGTGGASVDAAPTLDTGAPTDAARTPDLGAAPADAANPAVDACVPSPEQCNGRDDDCDTSIDEDLGLGEPCAEGVGACAVSGVFTCAPTGEVVCSARATNPTDERCDGLDNDCDGTVDEAPMDVGQPCRTGLPGVCGPGVMVCLDGKTECASTVEPSAEICNGVDDDCNEGVDESPDGLLLAVDCYSGPAGTDGVAACHGGRSVCTDGVFGPCADERLPRPELCDRVDNDCNGVVDDGDAAGCDCVPGTVEACYTGPVGTAGHGACQTGTWTCAEDGRSFGACLGERMPEVETCNGEDDDCDDRVDEDLPGVGEPCLAGEGACEAAGERVCDPGRATLVCNTGAGQPGVERCNGIDDDCDLEIDEDLDVGEPCFSGEGLCRQAGVLVCGPDGGVVCNAPEVPPEAERCNGMDDDCDGEVDEDFARGEACSAGQGACLREGVSACTLAGELACEAVPGPPNPEICNGADDDCDGETDEDTAGQGEACDTGRPGACAAGRRACENGVSACLPLDAGTPESCNGLDDDCDGLTDEALGGDALSRACYDGPGGTLGVGRCVGGLQTCAGGGYGACVGQVLPAAMDACDGLDNDCNGAVDDQPGGGGCACTPGERRMCYTGTVGTAGVGVCRTGEQTCDPAGAAWGPCGGEILPGVESCDRLDNDCDAEVDDVAGAGGACATGIGACRAVGTNVCDVATGRVACDAVAGAPADEVCDGLDNDCNGAVDDVPGRGGACSAGVGGCSRDGFFVCDAARRALVCSVDAGAPSPETCNQVDDDCDGVIDDGPIAGTGGACATGLPGACAAGTMTCRAGAVQCVAAAQPGQNAERCNGADDDCDGVVDDAPVDAGVPCTVEAGNCASVGVTVCAGPNSLVCNAQPGVPSREQCDGLDNDCDGQADEGLDCSIYQSCLDAYVRGAQVNGVYRIRPAGPDGAVYTVFCDQATDSGGWTLIGSALNTVLTDVRGDWHPDLMTMGPSAARDTLWGGLRPLGEQFDVRFVCRDAPSAEDAPVTVDLSFYRTSWYTRLTAGTDADACFNEGETALPLAPARRNNVTGVFLPRGNQYDYGYVESEDTCDAADDFAIDFDDRGKDSLQSDGTDWGKDDNTRKCGRSGLAGGQWMMLARERRRVAVVGADTPEVAAGLRSAGWAAETLPFDANLPGKLTAETYETLLLSRIATRWAVVTEPLKAALRRFSTVGGNVVTEWDGLSLFGEGYGPSFRFAAGAPAPLGFFRYTTGAGDVRGLDTPVLIAAVNDPLMAGLPVPFRAGTGTEAFFTLDAVGGAATWLSTVATMTGNGTPAFPAGNLPAVARGRRCGGNFLATTFDWQDNAQDAAVRQFARNLAAEAARPPAAALEDTCREPLRRDVLICGASARDAATFVRGGSPLAVRAGCQPDTQTQAMLVTRAGLAQLNAGLVQTYLAGGGIVITEQGNSDEIYNWAFNTFAVQAAARTGACRDNVMPAVQLGTFDPFWEENRFEATPGNTTGCGYDASAFPGLVPLGGPAPGVVTLGYRDLPGRGRVWVVESDWSDAEGDFTAASAGLMHWMITHGPRPMSLAGVQTNLDPDALARGGFEPCYVGDYAGGRLLFDVQQACDLGVLLMACRPAGAATWQVGAMSPRADVFFDVGAGANAVHAANGIDWYFSSGLSWGFAPGGTGVNRTPCDASAGDAAARLCWQTGNNNLNAGGRCGAATGLGVGWERMIFERPAPW